MPPNADMMVPTVDFPEVVSLNVGGHIYTTTLTTLRRDSASMLARMFSGYIGVRKDQNSNYFIDRDGTHFGLILNFLRDDDVDLPTSPLIRKQILRECLFYQIQSLIERLGGPGDLIPAPSTPAGKFDLLDQAALYNLRKQQLYVKHRQVWDEMKVTIKASFGEQAQRDSSILTCSFPLQQDTVLIAPFIVRELQDEGLRDITHVANYQSGVTFRLDLDNISDSDLAEQQAAAAKLLQPATSPSLNGIRSC